MQNVYIIGAQCTGKTTVVNALELQLAREGDPEPPAIIREVARTVLTEGNYTRDDITTSPKRALQLQRDILSAQFRAERSIAMADSSKSRWYISDRSGLDPIAYATVYGDPGSAQSLIETPEWSWLEANMKSGVVILCETGGDWLVDDGTRLMPRTSEEWDRVEGAFRALLDERDIRYTVLPRTIRSIDERVAFVNRQCKVVAEKSRPSPSC